MFNIFRYLTLCDCGFVYRLEFLAASIV